MTEEHWNIAENIASSAERYVLSYGSGFKHLSKDWKDIVEFSKQWPYIMDDDRFGEYMHRIVDGIRKYRGKRTHKEMLAVEKSQTQVAYNRFINDLYRLEALLDPQGCAAEPDADLTWLE